MKKRSLLLIALMFGITTPLLADVDTHHWQFSRQIETAADRALQRVTLDTEVHDKAQPGLADLRILDGEGKEVPFMVGSQDPGTGEKRLASTVTERRVDASSSRITADLGAAGGVFDRIRLTTKGDDFLQLCDIEASDDGAAWRFVRKGLSAFSLSADQTAAIFVDNGRESWSGYDRSLFTAQKLDWRVPETHARYVRVTLWHDLDKEPVGIASVDVYFTSKGAAEERSMPARMVKSERVADMKATDIIADLGAANLPVSGLRIGTDQKNYHRAIELFVSDDAKEWRRSGGGSVFSLDSGSTRHENSEIRLEGTMNGRYLKLRVHNGDSPALRLDSVSAFGPVRSVLFIAEPGKSYRLWYGNPAAERPVYDTAALLAVDPSDEPAAARLSAAEVNAAYAPLVRSVPWTEDKPYLLWGVMALAAFGLLFLAGRAVSQAGDNNGR